MSSEHKKTELKADERGAGLAESGEAAQMEVRRQKAERVRARGENPFANDFARGGVALTPLGEVRAHHDDAKNEAGRHDKEKVLARSARFRVAGRVLFLRSFGAGAFIRLRDRTGELQLYCEEPKLGEAFARLEDFDLGDFVEAEGTTTATDKGELSLAPESIRLLTKSIRPLPTKTSFKDVEQRYRARYVDLVANKDVAEVFRARSIIVSALRSWFDTRDFLEVETPTMTQLVGGAIARPFETHHNALDLKLFMRIAPELYLKRLVVGGFERVYEVARCYRNEGISTRHNPEFTMLEYYQAYATYDVIMDQTEELLRAADEALRIRMPQAHAAWLAARTFTLDHPFYRVPMRAAVLRALERSGLDEKVILEIDAPDAPIKEWAKAAKSRKREIDWSNFKKGMLKCESPGERMFAAYEYLAEPFLVQDYRTDDGNKSVPVFVIDHPTEVSPLARKKDSDPSLTDRFELFIDGREICNAFSELNDPDDQAARFRAQVERKARGAEETMDYDEDYIRALEHGMPPTAGFGMGVDRLAMFLTGAASIRDVILFPLLRPEGDAADKS
jgi:lysyl-tRNA synthetase class 2